MDSIKSFPKFTIFFAFIMAFEILALTIIPQYHIVTKGLIMASIIGFYILTVQPQDNVFLLGLIFALLGDAFLLFKGNDFFTIGLICFLIMQICYSATFKKKKRIARSSAYIVPGLLVLLGAGVIGFLWSDLGVLRNHIILYAIAIIVMASFAYLRHPKLRGYAILLFGVLLFIISDALLAFNLFGGGFKNAQIYVMITYMVAQYCIVTGEVLSILKRKEEAPEINSSFGRHKVGK